MMNNEVTQLIKEYKKTGNVQVSDSFIVSPSFCDVHVHFREPGFSYKETILSGSRAAARGGYTSVLTMPNLKPCPDTLENLKMQLDIIKRDAIINVIPYGTITKDQNGENLSDMEAIKDYVCAFSDDGRGVQNNEIMHLAMQKAKSLDKMIVAHCEDNSLLCGGCIHDGEWAKNNGFIGISSASEYKQVERDIELVKETGVKYHVCHISTKESVELIRQAKKDGVDISCETGPHYLTLTDNDLIDDGRFKMNPPLRSVADRDALIEGVMDGTIDAIATDHAPHSKDEKSKGLMGSSFGIVGLETAFPILYTDLVLKGIVPLEKIIDLLAYSPRRRFDLPLNEGYTVFEIENPYKITEDDFLSMGKSTPYIGREVYGKCILTVLNNKVVFKA